MFIKLRTVLESPFLRRTEPVLRSFRVPIGASIALVIIAGLVVVGRPPEVPSRITTEGIEAGTVTEVDETLTEPGAEPTDPGTAAPATGGRQAPVRVIRKGGLIVTVSQSGEAVANLFTAAEDRIGITDTGGLFGKGQILLCGHAATTFGPAFNTAPEDLDVYWRWLNDQGGVHSRNVIVTWENDNYDPTTAVTAAQACKQKNPFILLGGIGFDQIPAVRNFVEQNRMFYIHHIARSDPAKQFSFAPLPTVENVGALAGDWVRRRFPNKTVGVIYRDSDNWIPGKDAFVRALGRQPKLQVAVARNRSTYNDVLVQMQTTNPPVDLIFAWENALAQTEMIQQAKGQNYHPQWMVFPFNLVTDTLGDQAMNPVLHGIATWPAYSPGDYSGPFAEYADEIKRFEAAYKKYRDVPLTDIHWMTWLAWKSIHYTFDQCGRECTRNKVIGVMVKQPYGYDLTRPNCPLDFTRNGREGGYWANMFESYKRPNGSVGWRHIQGAFCKEAWS